jgi:hypothetical protein
VGIGEYSPQYDQNGGIITAIFCLDIEFPQIFVGLEYFDVFTVLLGRPP